VTKWALEINGMRMERAQKKGKTQRQKVTRQVPSRKKSGRFYQSLKGGEGRIEHEKGPATIEERRTSSARGRKREGGNWVFLPTKLKKRASRQWGWGRVPIVEDETHLVLFGGEYHLTREERKKYLSARCRRGDVRDGGFEKSAGFHTVTLKKKTGGTLFHWRKKKGGEQQATEKRIGLGKKKTAPWTLAAVREMEISLGGLWVGSGRRGGLEECMGPVIGSGRMYREGGDGEGGSNILLRGGGIPPHQRKGISPPV